MSKPPPRTAPAIVGRRWCGVLAAGVLLFAAVLLAAWIWRARLAGVAGEPWWLITACVAAPIVALLFYLGPVRFFGAFGLRHTLVHPPYWIGATLGVAGAFATISNIEAISADFRLDAATEQTLEHWALAISLVPVALLVVHALLWPFRDRGRDSRWEEGTVPVPSPTVRTLDAWYAGDNAVVSAADDLLDYELIAERIARRLVTDRAQAQALLGRLGAGKTTVRFLVEEFLRIRYPRAPINVVSVELWPYDTPAAAVEGILRAVIDALAEHVHTSQLNGLPEAYAEAIATAAGVSTWVPRVRERVATPSEILKRLDDVVNVIDRRIVLWVDDLERFAFGNPGASDKDPAELGRLSPIRALLYGLDRLDSITVVTATTNLFQRFDLEKIARYVERIPDIPPRKARDIIRKARDEWMSRKQYIDPVTNRATLGWENSDREGYEFLDHTVHDLASAVSALAVTPRTLKQALRRVSEIWDRQAGEIDLDDLLAMSMVRESVPDAFAIIEQHERKLRDLDPDHRSTKENPVALVNKEVEALKLDSRITKAVALIVHTVFDKHKSRPQGLRRDDHADYWHRFMTGAEIAGDQSDQTVLRTLRTGTDADIVNLLSDPNRSAAVRDFAHELTSERIQGLLLPLVAARLDEDPASWPKQKEPPGLLPIWHMLLGRAGSLDQVRLFKDTIKALELAAPKNIALMEQVRQWMIAEGRVVRSVLSNDQRTTIINRSLELLRDLYTGKPEALGASLKNAFPYTLHWLFWTERQRSGGSREQPFVGWPQFADTLRAALGANPVDVARQIAALVVRQLRDPEQLALDQQRCDALFGEVDKLVTEIKTSLAERDAGPLVAALLEKRESPYSDEEGNAVLDAGEDIDDDMDEDDTDADDGA